MTVPVAYPVGEPAPFAIRVPGGVVKPLDILRNRAISGQGRCVITSPVLATGVDRSDEMVTGSVGAPRRARKHKPCAVADCGKSAPRGRFCAMHQSRLRSRGSLETPPRSRERPLYQKILRNLRVNRGTGCWEWTGWVPKNGYPSISIGPRVGRRCVLLHRMMMEHRHGKLPRDIFVCHRCDNRRCCNPSHLFLGSPADNIRDASTKGRLASGERHPWSKLTKEDAVYIRESGLGKRSLARKFNVHPKTVQSVKRGLTWRAG